MAAAAHIRELWDEYESGSKLLEEKSESGAEPVEARPRVVHADEEGTRRAEATELIRWLRTTQRVLTGWQRHLQSEPSGQLEVGEVDELWKLLRRLWLHLDRGLLADDSRIAMRLPDLSETVRQPALRLRGSLQNVAEIVNLLDDWLNDDPLGLTTGSMERRDVRKRMLDDSKEVRREFGKFLDSFNEQSEKMCAMLAGVN